MVRNWLGNVVGGITNKISSDQIKKFRIKRPGFAFVRGYGKTNRHNFEGPPVDLSEITKAYARDGYVRQAVDKYVELFFTAGWDLVGKNQRPLII